METVPVAGRREGLRSGAAETRGEGTGEERRERLTTARLLQP
jgi:hypothetical protein